MASNTPTPAWLTIRGAAVYASVSSSTIRTWLTRGLPSVKPSIQTRLIRAADIDAFLEAMKTGPVRAVDGNGEGEG